MQSTASSTGCRNKGCFALWGVSCSFFAQYMRSPSVCLSRLSVCLSPLPVCCVAVAQQQSQSPRLRVACVFPRLPASLCLPPLRRRGLCLPQPKKIHYGRVNGDEQPQLTGGGWLGWGRDEPFVRLGGTLSGITTWRVVAFALHHVVVRSWSLFLAM